jgi:hypothetical protein
VGAISPGLRPGAISYRAFRALGLESAWPGKRINFAIHVRLGLRYDRRRNLPHQSTIPTNPNAHVAGSGIRVMSSYTLTPKYGSFGN